MVSRISIILVIFINYCAAQQTGVIRPIRISDFPSGIILCDSKTRTRNFTFSLNEEIIKCETKPEGQLNELKVIPEIRNLKKIFVKLECKSKYLQKYFENDFSFEITTKSGQQIKTQNIKVIDLRIDKFELNNLREIELGEWKDLPPVFSKDYILLNRNQIECKGGIKEKKVTFELQTIGNPKKTQIRFTSTPNVKEGSYSITCKIDQNNFVSASLKYSKSDEALKKLSEDGTEIVILEEPPKMKDSLIQPKVAIRPSFLVGQPDPAGRILKCEWQPKKEIYSTGRHCAIEFNKVSKQLEGKYSLNVNFNQKSLKFLYDVKVLMRLRNTECKLPDLFVTFVGDVSKNSLPCKFAQSVSQIEYSLNDGIKTTITNPESTTIKDVNANERVRLEFDNSLESISVKILTNNPTTQLNKLTLKISNKISSWQHTIYFGVTNKVSQQVGAVYPAKQPCKELQDRCNPDLSRTIRCMEDFAEFKKYYERFSLKVDAFWMFKKKINERIELDDRYFRVNKTTMDLFMPSLTKSKNFTKKIQKSLKERLEGSTLQCVIQFSYLPPFNSEASPLLSQNDEALSKMMRVNIKIKEPPNYAQYFMIAGIIVGILIIFAIIIVYVRHRIKNRGETYHLQRVERYHGVPDDPPQFQDYVREELPDDYMKELNFPISMQMTHQPLQERTPQSPAGVDFPPRQRLLDDGSDANDLEDITEQYRHDPSQYEESASFVGKYDENPRV